VPLNDIYVAGTAGMDYFVSCDALGNLRFSSQQASAWKIPEAVSAMEDGTLLFAGKYSTPDYELLTSEHCDLALENTMIYHSPAVIEQLESLGIPVFIDNSSNETTPQGRMEWVKVFGLLAGREAEADRAFRAQEKEFKKLESIADRDAECPSVAFFSVRSNGTVTVRQATDYIPKMIDIAGGRYVFEDLRSDGEGIRSTQVISMEEFYSTAKDADYFILNSSIEGERTSVEELLKDAPVLADCKAVREGHVYCTYADLYQHSMGQGDFVRDLHEMLTGGTGFTYIFKLDE
jgi:ABC-type Fe3+-hydroxamate transport system, periplasmic component